jgi:altronate dehydratase
MEEHAYPLEYVRHAFLSVGSGLATGLAEGERIVRGWIEDVESDVRTEAPLSGLRIALQCGGSDAFSGVSGNPLAGAVVHELIRHGGIGVLCETDEVAGAEAYVMRYTRDLATAKAVLKHIEGFTERLSWHGVTPESNPSGGNKLRGLYNITLKSLGAVHKKDPRTPVDHVIDYAQPLSDPGFYFMNSPGNDLEGIAGQVASGCNLLLFVTGNGSITNFPFVPTLKITTTSKRHELLRHEMDVNAGRYLDGEPMEALAADTFDLVIETASGARTKGELAGHSQAQLWRNWRQTSPGHVAAVEARPVPDGHPLRVKASPAAWGEGPARPRTDRIGLVLPTSMCSSQIARLAAARLNDTSVGLRHGIDRFVALPHSEGCGFGGGAMYDTLQRTFRGYATHPNVVAALLLEHGCEKVPNDAMRRDFERAGLALDRFGWASVQLDGGIDQSIARVQQWFATRPASDPVSRDVALGLLTIGLCCAAAPDAATTALLVAFVNAALADGGTVLIPEGDPLVAEPAFVQGVLGDIRPHATLAYGQPVAEAGLHLVQTDTDHWVENVTGLAACGSHLVLGAVANGPEQGHPLIPVLQVAGPSLRGVVSEEDVDVALSLGSDPDANLERLVELVLAAARRDYVPTAQAGGFVEFQLTRGLLGVST